MGFNQERKPCVGLTLAFLLALFLAEPVFGDTLDTWTQRNPGVNADFRAVGGGNGLYIVGGTQGELLTSPDGISWTSRNSGGSTWLADVAYGANTFVIVGQNGKILTSTDGAAWTVRPSGTSANFGMISFINGFFIAIGDRATIGTSPDGITWTYHDSGIVNSNSSVGIFYWIAYGNNTYLIGGPSSTTLTSPDLIHWSQHDAGISNPNLIFGNGLFASLGFQDASDSLVQTSPDGVTWASHGILPFRVPSKIDYAPGYFVACGQGGGIHTSSDGTNWIARGTPVGGILWNVKYINGTFMAVGENGVILQTPIVLTPPVVTQQPSNNTVFPGSNAVFNITATGGQPLYYQWFNSTKALGGKTNATLILTNCVLSQAGSYFATVSNSLGVTNSSNAFLVVLDTSDSDHDGIPNYWELQYGLNPDDPNDAATHPPGDKLTYFQKYIYGLDPAKLDTDSDGLSDYDEIFVYHTNPLSTNTSGDGIPDGWKVQYGLNPLVANANDEIGASGVSYMQLYQYNLAQTNQAGQLDPRNPFFAPGISIYESLNQGQHTNRMYYDHKDRLVGIEYSRGISIAYRYDGNDNLVGQTVLSRASETNGLPVLWLWLNSLTNQPGIAYTDSDGDGWTDYQEWKAGTDPRNTQSFPNGADQSAVFETAPSAIVLPPTAVLTGTAVLTIRLWDAEGNVSMPFLQYQLSGSTNWQDATLLTLDGSPYSATTRVSALPFGVSHILTWNASADLGNVITNILLRVRAQDFGLMGNWSLPTPAAINTLPPLEFAVSPSSLRLATNGFHLQISGLMGTGPVVIFRSTNLLDWKAILTNPPVFGDLSFVDSDVTNHPASFYRVTEQR